MQVSSSLNTYPQTPSYPIQKVEQQLPVQTLPSEETPIPNDNVSLKENDEARQAVVAYAGYQSKIRQMEIYIQGSTGEKVDLSSSTNTLVEGYVEAKKNSDALNAYTQNSF